MGSVVQKKKKGLKKRFHEVLNLHCDLDHEHNNPILTQDTPTYDNVPSNLVAKVHVSAVVFKKGQWFSRLVETVISDY